MTGKIPKKKKRIGIDEYGRTLLHNAIIDQDLKAARKYITSGYDINLTDDNGWTPLHFACQNYDLKSVKLLIENGSKLDPIDKYGNTPLFKAVFNCRNNKGDLIKYLLTKGANPNLKNHSNISPMDLANTIANFNIKDYFK